MQGLMGHANESAFLFQVQMEARCNAELTG